MLYTYVFSLVLGGVLLAASALLGHGDSDAHAGGGDGGPDGEADHGGHQGDVHHAETSTGAGLDGAHGFADFFFWPFRSLRFWTFFLAFFGLTGVLLHALGILESRLASGIVATLTGGVIGFGATAAIRFLTITGTSSHATSRDYIGLMARVLVPVTSTSDGKVRVQIKDQTVDLLATTDEAESFKIKEEGVVVGMAGTRARIARFSKELG